MSDEEKIEILRKIFQKAYGGHFSEELFNHKIKLCSENVTEEILSHTFAIGFWGDISILMPVGSIHHSDICTIIEVDLEKECVKTDWSAENPNGQLIKDLITDKPAWEYHLQQLVLEETEDDKINYLKEFL